MSAILPELDVEVVSIAFSPIGGGSPVTYYFAEDYWPAGTLYADSPGCYPLLASSPKLRRGVNAVSGIKADVPIPLYADTHLSELGKTINDLLKTHEVHSAEASVRYYPRPIDEVSSDAVASGDDLASIPLWGGIYAALPSPGGSVTAGDRAHLAFTYRGFWDTAASSMTALATHSDSVNIRQTLRVIDTQYAKETGILTLRCKDVWFKNKEISRKLSSRILTNLDPNLKGEYGSLVFGQSTIAGKGIPIDAPFFDSKINGIGEPEAKLFAGWGFDSHYNGYARMLVKNQTTDAKDQAAPANHETWLQVALQDSGQDIIKGESVSTPVADPPSWERDLTRYERAIIYTPAADAAEILTAVRTPIKINTRDRCADMSEGQYFYCKKNPDIFSHGDDDLSIALWVKFDSLHTSAGKRVICQQGNQRKKGKLEWILYFDTSSDAIRFGISGDGKTIDKSIGWSSALSTNTWYFIVACHDEDLNKLRINVNAGTTVEASTGTTEMDGRDGTFTIGSRNAVDPSFDGQIKFFGYWSRVLNDGDILNLYNNGVPKLVDDFSDYESLNLNGAVDFNDPYGTRFGSSGSLDLDADATVPSIPHVIPYAYASNAVLVPSNKYGELSIEIGPAAPVEGGANYTMKTSLRKSVIDVTTPAIAGTLADVYFQIDPPLVMVPGVPYMIALRMANASTNSYFALCSYDFHLGSTHFALDKRTKREKDQPTPNWTAQGNVRLDMRLCLLGQDNAIASTLVATVAGSTYNYWPLDARSITLSSGQTQLEFNKNIDIKLCVAGLSDNPSGTYTGTGGSRIERTTHIQIFILMHAEELGLTPAQVDLSSFATAETVLQTKYPGGLKMQIVINSETDAESFLVEICRQSRTIIYKTKDGKIALKAPVPHDSFDAVFTEMKDRGDFDLLSVADNDYQQILNEFHQYYFVDPVNQPSDPAFLRINPEEKLANELYITPTESSSGDSYYQGLCAASQALFDRREYAAPLDFYDSAIWGQPVQNYYCARYSSLQKRATFRVSRREFYAFLDLFSAINLQHTALPDASGTYRSARGHSTGMPVLGYYEGTPVLCWMAGQLDGQVVEVQEEGPWMTFTIETISPFK